MFNVRRFVHDERGATAIEYGLIAALVSVAAIGALISLGDSLQGIYNALSSTIDGTLPSGATP